MTWIAISVLVAWTLALTVLTLGLAKNIARIDLARNSGRLPVYDLDDAGPEHGTPILRRP